MFDTPKAVVQTPTQSILQEHLKRYCIKSKIKYFVNHEYFGTIAKERADQVQGAVGSKSCRRRERYRPPPAENGD
jgi:hypothetical protein